MAMAPIRAARLEIPFADRDAIWRSRPVVGRARRRSELWPLLETAQHDPLDAGWNVAADDARPGRQVVEPQYLLTPVGRHG